ncbi:MULTISPECIES: IclR family transcriptional regulator C-terminal domain-containing protein [Rhodomicrobium]|uniref:IclR family transcriptional regulator domain-containing protein n=1 Tax=Rhodomicrobium TaxID=1068 RepID=UPI001AECE46A|nr:MULTISPECIES: IclR family transcriptional regulator C-terminal domain-containing protein [Rhodomicrobium]
MRMQNSAEKNAKAGRDTEAAEPRGDTVQSLSRALNLLNRLAESDQGLTLSEAANRTGLAISTAHRLLSTLQRENFVRFEPERGVWLIGVQAFIVGSAFLRSRELTGIARPLMRQLMERSGETVNLAVEDRGEAIYVAQIECRKTMRAIASPGGRAAMHASGVGKALLAAMTEEEVERVIRERGLPEATPRSIATRARLKAELQVTRARGFAIDDEENAIGLRCVAAAIFDETGRPAAALSLSGPKARITDDLLSPLGDQVRAVAGQITNQIGGVNLIR